MFVFRRNQLVRLFFAQSAQNFGVKIQTGPSSHTNLTTFSVQTAFFDTVVLKSISDRKTALARPPPGSPPGMRPTRDGILGGPETPKMSAATSPAARPPRPHPQHKPPGPLQLRGHRQARPAGARSPNSASLQAAVDPGENISGYSISAVSVKPPGTHRPGPLMTREGSVNV